MEDRQRDASCAFSTEDRSGALASCEDCTTSAARIQATKDTKRVSGSHRTAIASTSRVLTRSVPLVVTMPKRLNAGLTPDARLRLHQEGNGPLMDQLHGWLEALLAERRTEPNSGLGHSLIYLLRHWHPLTLFLPKARALLDNNIVERSLKRAILNQKNALFYRTLNALPVA